MIDIHISLFKIIGDTILKINNLKESFETNTKM